MNDALPSTTEPELRPRGNRASGWLLAACLLVVGLTLAPSLRGEFVYDDLSIVGHNPAIASFARLPELFTSAMWDFAHPEATIRVGYWRPLSGVALMLGRWIGGGSPLGFHVVSLLLHLAATAAAFRLARRLSRSDAVALGAALLFGLHPVHVESVSWISAVNEPLYALFALLSVDAFLAWRESGSRDVPWRSAAWLVPALLSKELAVAVVPLAIAIDLGRSRAADRPANPAESSRGILRAYAPFAAVLFLYWLARAAVFGGAAAGFDSAITDFGVPASRLLQLRFELLGGFVRLLAWPASLSLFHPFVPDLPFSSPTYLLDLLGVAALAALAWILWRRRAAAGLIAALAIPAALAPVLTRVEALGIFPLSERYLYVAALGPALLVSLVCLRRLPRGVGVPIVLALALACGVRAANRVRVWHDEESLFRAAVLESPRVPYVRWGLARVLLGKYRATKDLDALREAHQQADAGLDLLASAQRGDGSIFGTRSDHVQTNLCLAWALLYEAELDPYHDFDTPRRVFASVAARYPDSEHAHAGLGVALMQLGKLDEAQAALEKALQLNPGYAEAWHNLGLLATRKGDPKAAIASFEKAIALTTEDQDDLVLLAGAHADAGEREAALAVIARALARFPRASAPLALRGKIAARAGDMDEALRWADKALEANRDDGDALLLRGKILLARGEKASARTALLRAADLMPQSFEVHYYAASVLLASEGVSAAMPYLLRAYETMSKGAAATALRETLKKIELDDPDTTSRLAAIDMDRGEDDEALEWLARALDAHPDHGKALFLRGVLAKKRRDLALAEVSWKQACTAMPESFQAQQELGTLLAEQKRNAEALPYLERALEIARKSEGSNPQARLALDALQETIERLKRGG